MHQGSRRSVSAVGEKNNRQTNFDEEGTHIHTQRTQCSYFLMNTYVRMLGSAIVLYACPPVFQNSSGLRFGGQVCRNIIQSIIIGNIQ